MLSRAPGQWVWKQHQKTGSWYRVHEALNIWDGPYTPFEKQRKGQP